MTEILRHQRAAGIGGTGRAAPSVADVRRRLPAGRSIYAVVTWAYLVGIYVLSSVSDFWFTGQTDGRALASNLLHIPLYAGLALCFLKAISNGQSGGATAAGYGLTLLATGAYAALDELHQSFVPGRYASVGDFLLDLTGIAGMLAICSLKQISRAARRTHA